jgi:hypothetical protein
MGRTMGGYDLERVYLEREEKRVGALETISLSFTI